jgi:hypothetical protein
MATLRAILIVSVMSVTTRETRMSAAVRAAMILIALLALGVSATAGQVFDMQGQMVRVQLRDQTLTEGVVQQWTSDSLELTGAGGLTSQFGWAEVYEVLRYRTRGHAGRGLLVGALLGAAVAGTHAGVTWEPCTFACFGPQDRGGTIALAALLGGVAGGALGALVGTGIRTAAWEPVAIPVVSSNSAALRLGVRLSTAR